MAHPPPSTGPHATTMPLALMAPGAFVLIWSTGFLVGRGVAWSYRWGRNPGPFKDEETRARQARKGVFSESPVELPRDFRKRHGPCPMPPR